MSEIKQKIEQHIRYNKNVSSMSVSETDALVYAIICLYIDKDTNKGYPTIDTLYKESKLRRNTILKSIKNLEANGFIKLKKIIQKDSNGKLIPNKYPYYEYTVDKLNKDFVMMSKRFIQLDIDNNLKAFLIKIHPLFLTDIEGMRAKMYITYADLALLCNCNESTIRRRISKLLKLGIIEECIDTLSKEGHKRKLLIFNLVNMKQELLKHQVDDHEVRLSNIEKRLEKQELEIAYLYRVNRIKSQHLSKEEKVKERLKLNIALNN